MFCGIAGYAGLNDQDLLERMIAALKHRGPDDTGLFADTGIGLANARLSIIDIEGGHQPIHNEDGTIQVTYNGELYNYRDLRRELEALGHRFYTKSDTEVIVHSYEQYGDDFVSRLNGMFAIALWDAPNKKLVLARDRMGIKPLYYTMQNGGLLFASEIKGILQAKIPRAVDRTSLFAIINLGYVPGDRTLLDGVFKLPPSSILVYKDGSVKVSQYWDVPPIEALTNEDHVVARLQEVLEESVRDQLVADVPVGCFLSGGLDSVSGDARLFYKIGDQLHYGTIARFFQEVQAKRVLKKDRRTLIVPMDQVAVLTSTDLRQHHARVTWSQVKALYSHRTDKDMYEIRLRGGRRIVVTGDHSVFKVRSSHRTLVGEPVPARSLRKGDRLYVAAETSLNDMVDISQATHDETDLLTLGGLYTADGYLSKDGRHISIAAGKDKEVVEFLRTYGQKKILRELNLTDKIAIELQSNEYSHNLVRQLSRKYGCSPQVVYVAKNRKLTKQIATETRRFAVAVSKKGDVNFSSKPLSTWLRRKGFAGDSHSKRVPEWLLTAEQERIAAFLRGYFSGDGSAYKIRGVRPVVNCCSVHKQLVLDIQILLMRLGIYAVISGPSKPGRSSYPCSNESYILTINRKESLRRFHAKVGFLQTKKNRCLALLKGGRKAYPLTSATIRSIRRLPAQIRTVYDLHVEGTERFIANGILCHNTSTIVAYASKAVSQPLKTFCMGFGEDTDEFRDARLVAEHFGTDHHEIMVDSSQGVKLYPKMIWHMESPKYNLYPWFVCELVHKYVKVCLSGNGGDEVFGGYYARYLNALRIDRLSRKPLSPLLRFSGGVLQPMTGDIKTANRLRVLNALGNNTAEYMILAGVLPDSVNKKLFRNGEPSADLGKHYSKYFKGTDLLQGLMNGELRTKLVDDLLSVDDTMSMAHSLELRVPLLDNRTVDLMTVVPWRMKYSPGTHGKLLLRKATRGVLPEDSLRKPKWGFSVNVDMWYNGELGELVRQIVPESDVIGKYFNQSFIRSLLSRRLSQRDRRYQVLLWQLLGFHFWHRIFIDSEQAGAVRLELNALVA